MPIATSPSPTLLYLRLPNWLGDVCMCLPIVEALLQQPHYELVIVGRPWVKQLLKHYPITHWLLINQSTRDSTKIVKEHRQRHAHRAAKGLIIPDSFSSAWIFWRARIPSAGVRDEGRSLFLRWSFTKPAQTLHVVAYWYQVAMDALAAWDTPMPALTGHQLKLRLPKNTTAIQKILAPHQAAQTVLIAPTATGQHQGKIKVWPHFEALTKRLIARHIRVIMCPPENEIRQAEENAPSAERLPPLPIDQFAQLCRSVGVVVCNDSGVSHVAAAAQAKQITLFGVTSAQRTGPWSELAICLGRDDQWPSVDEVFNHCLKALEITHESA